MPHEWIFPQCSCVIHHGGAGTLARTLQSGVPSIIVPILKWADQAFWARNVQQQNLGVHVTEKNITENVIKDAIEIVTTSKIIQDKYKSIKANNELKKLWRYWEINDFDFTVWKDNGCWPFYSLRPSISKVDTIINTGYHNEDIIKWPFQFEFEWALKWIRRNDIVVGIPININVTRDDKHNSSYNMEDYNRWLNKLKTKPQVKFRISKG